MTIIWSMIPEIWSTTDIIFGHSGPFFALFPSMDPANQNFQKMQKTSEDIIILQTQMAVIWCMVPQIWSMWRTEFFVIFDGFFPFYTPNNPKNQNIEKLKKKTGDIIILQVYHKWQSYDVSGLMYGSWDMKRDRHNFLSFWTIFCPFTTKWRSYNIWFLKHKVWQTENLVILGHLLPFQPLDNPKNQVF